MIKLKK